MAVIKINRKLLKSVIMVMFSDAASWKPSCQSFGCAAIAEAKPVPEHAARPAPHLLILLKRPMCCPHLVEAETHPAFFHAFIYKIIDALNTASLIRATL